MRATVPLAFTALSCLACFGSATDKPADDGTGDGVVQSDVCADYLSCVADVDPGSFAALTGTYGPDGDCWAGDQSFADDCTAVCLSTVTDLADANRSSDACKAYAPPAAPLADGEWTLVLEIPKKKDGCGLADATGTTEWVLGGDVLSTGAGTFTWSGDNGWIYLNFDCTYDGADFTCDESTDGEILSLDGTAHGDAADGSWSMEATGTQACTSTGTFTANEGPPS